MKKVYTLILISLVLISCSPKPIEYTSVTEGSLKALMNAYPAYMEKVQKLGLSTSSNNSAVTTNATAPKVAKQLEKELLKHRLSPETFGFLLERVSAGYTHLKMEEQMAGQNNPFGNLMKTMMPSMDMVSEQESTVIKNNFKEIEEMFQKAQESLS